MAHHGGMATSTTRPDNSEPGPDPGARPATGLGRVRALEALPFREFRLLWLGQLTTAMGTWIDQIARGWLLYELTGSPIQLGLVGFLRVFPLIFLSPIAGTMADRYGRKTQLITAQTVNAVANAVLGLLILHGGVEPWHVYVTGLVNATVQVFQQPPRQAMVPESVERPYLTNAIALNSIAFNVSRTFGPAVAGAVIALIGPGGSYLIQAGIYMLSSMWTAQLRLPNRPPAAQEGRTHAEHSFVGSTVHGWRYIVGHETIRTALLASAVVSFFGFSVSALLPVFAKDVLVAARPARDCSSQRWASGRWSAHCS